MFAVVYNKKKEEKRVILNTFTLINIPNRSASASHLNGIPLIKDGTDNRGRGIVNQNPAHFLRQSRECDHVFVSLTWLLKTYIPIMETNECRMIGQFLLTKERRWN